MRAVAGFFHLLNDQLLSMKWLSALIGLFTERVLRLPLSTPLGGSLHFFIYDTIKIFILLSVLIFAISYVQSYFPPERTRRILGKYKGVGANLMGALLGTVTPFCSCSSIPLFIGFTSAGLPIGVTFSFLISSPLVDLASMLLLASIFGWKIAAAYVVVGVLLATVGGSVITKLNMTDQIEPFVLKTRSGDAEEETLTGKERIDFAFRQVADIIKKVWFYVLIGVFIGSLIHNWIPENIIGAVLGSSHWYSVPLATFVGIPMYADIFGTLPIAEALLGKGVGLGTVLAFMMAVTALSLPSIIMLKKVVRPKLLGIFVGIVTAGILIIGFGFNMFSYLFI